MWQKTSRFFKNKEVSELLSKLRIGKTPLSNTTIIGNI